MKQQYFSQIKNPMTIIALFVGLIEIGLGPAFSRAPESLQSPFLCFMIGFPCLVCIGFFLVLFFRPHHFYSPGDYRSDESYLAAHRVALSETLMKIPETKRDMEAKPPAMDILKLMTDNLPDFFSWYLLKVTNKAMSVEEHIAALRKEWESSAWPYPSGNLMTWASVGYHLSSWITLNHLLFEGTYDREKNKLIFSLSPEVVRLLMQKVRPETANGSQA